MGTYWDGIVDRNFLGNSTPKAKMKPTPPYRNDFKLIATTPCRGLSLSR